MEHHQWVSLCYNRVWAMELRVTSEKTKMARTANEIKFWTTSKESPWRVPQESENESKRETNNNLDASNAIRPQKNWFTDRSFQRKTNIKHSIWIDKRNSKKLYRVNFIKRISSSSSSESGSHRIPYLGLLSYIASALENGFSLAWLLMSPHLRLHYP